MTNPLGHTTAMTYWPLGQLKSRTVTGFSDITYTYDAGGFLEQMQTANGTWSYAHGPLGELHSVSLPGGLGTYEYHYEADRLLSKIEPPGGVDQEFGYDGLRRPSRRTRGTSVWLTEWSGGLGQTSAPEGVQRSVLMDGRGRVAMRTFAGAPGLTSVSYDYDNLDQPLRVEESDSQTGPVTTTFGYDFRGRVTSRARPGSHVGYSYSDAEQGVSVTVTPTGGSAVTYVYDARGLLDLAGDIDLDWNDDGLLRQISGRGLSQTRSYLPGRKLLAGIELSSGSSTWSYAYDYDGNGNRTRETYVDDAGNTEETRYGYDVADRLTGVRYPDGTAHLYALRGDGARAGERHVSGYPVAGALGRDAFGSVTSPDQDLVFSFNASDGLSGITDAISGTTGTVTTDGLGRVTTYAFAGVSRSYAWDAAERLLSVTDTSSGETTSYAYDYAGWRTRKQGPGGAVDYVWGVDGLVLESDSAGARTMVRGAGLVLAAGSEVFGHDALGSVVLRLPSAGSATAHRFDVWGGYRANPPTGPPGNATGFTGHENDPETGLVYAQARYLDPALGRFLSTDPFPGVLDEPFSTQGFTYAHSNPTRFTDPTGEFVEIFWAAAKAQCVATHGFEGCTLGQQFDELKNLARLGFDNAVSVGKLGLAARDFVQESYQQTAWSLEQGEYGDAALAFSGIGAVKGKAETRYAYLRARGAGTGEAAGIMVGDVTGFTSLSEGWTGETLEANALTTAERWQRGITGGTQVLGTALGGVGLVRSLGTSTASTFSSGGSLSSIVEPQSLALRGRAGVSMRELIDEALYPGKEGVALTDRTVRFGDLSTLSEKLRVEVSLATERHGLDLVKVIRSGSADSVRGAPFGPGNRTVAHTHLADSIDPFTPSSADVVGLNQQWSVLLSKNASAVAPQSRVVWGSGNFESTLFKATSPFDVVRPALKRKNSGRWWGLKPERR